MSWRVAGSLSFFIIDYKQQCSLIEEISRIDSTRCRYNFNGVKNVDTVQKVTVGG